MRFHFMVDVRPVGRLKKLEASAVKQLTDSANSAVLHTITENIPFDADVSVRKGSCTKAHAKAKGGSR